MKRRKGQRCDRFLATPSMPSMFVFFQCSCVHVPQCPTLCSLYDIKTARTKSSRASRCPDKPNILRGVVHDGCLMIFAWPCCLDLKTHANTEEFDVIIADLQQPQPLHSWNLEKQLQQNNTWHFSMAIICYVALLQRIFFHQHTELNGFTLAKVFLKSFFSSVNDYCLCNSWRVALSYMQKWSKGCDIYTCLHIHLWQPCESLAQCCQSNPAKSAKLRVARHPLGFTSVAQWGLTSLTSWPCFLSWKQICQYVTVNFSDCRSIAISNPDASFPVVREQSYTSCTREHCSSWTVHHDFDIL